MDAGWGKMYPLMALYSGLCLSCTQPDGLTLENHPPLPSPPPPPPPPLACIRQKEIVIRCSGFLFHSRQTENGTCI